jgi:guanylate kinase
MNTKKPGLIIVISGPSGVGKDAVFARLKAMGYRAHYAITATTRFPRGEEQDGVNYHFLSEDEFKGRIDNGGLLEWAQVYGRYYGVPREEVETPVQNGDDVVVKVDVQGAATLKAKFPESLAIFILPPSEDELADRLKKRATDSADEMRHRLEVAQLEIKRQSIFDLVVVNQRDRLDETVARVMDIIRSRKAKEK